ncbi:hypothetical protein N7G274_003522 [Stereocaulon virgatum]|uniref:RRM domain-containing protein n=1 Tax=Stereocaulon virgatum TaxID=373712 RepID=A0ABR4AGN0_9LECA
MDRPLEDVISERQRRGTRGGRGRRGNNWSRDDSRKWNNRTNSTENIDTDWVHDKYDDDSHTAPRQPYRQPRNARNDRYSPEPEAASAGARLRVDNLHYDLTEDDLEDLFTRIAPVTSLSLRFDRAGRSSGTAFVTYPTISAANRAIREFDGANAAGQPIRLTLLPTAPSVDLIRGRAGAAPRNPFDTAVKPSRSLFERIDDPNGRAVGRSRSRSPGAPRRTDVTKPPPEGVDRYIPPANGSRRRSRTRSPRRRSPVSRNRSPIRGRGRGRGDDRERGERGQRGQRMVNGRPRKTQEELDKEMEDYWGSTRANGEANGESNGGQQAEVPAAAAVEDDDIDMII